MNTDADLEKVTQLTNRLIDATAQWGLKVLGAIVVLIVGRMVAGWVRGLVRKACERAKLDVTLAPFISGLVYWGILIAVLVAALGMVGVQTASLLAILGAAGLAIGLAMQGTLSNIAAGVMLLIFRPFRVGDYVETANTAGSVEMIGLFMTTLNTPDNIKIFVPNSKVWGDTVKNFTANDTRRNDLVISISYGDDIQVAKDTIRKVLDSDNRVLTEPAAIIAVNTLADSSVDLVVRPWCKREDYWDLRWELTRQLKESLEAAGCTIPFPQRDTHVYHHAIDDQKEAA